MSTRMVLRSCLASVLLCCAFSVNAERYTIPLLVPAGATGDPHGVVRILNDAQESATVTIHAIDDAGVRTGPAILTLSALSAVELGASELESGDAAKGLSVGLGRLSSEVRLVIDSDVPIVPSAYVRNADGTLAAMNATVLEAARAGLEAYRYDVPVFHPASNATHPSRLRLINPGESAARVTIAARDDAGAAASGGTVELTLPAGGARTLSADQLEVGDNAVLTGRLGAGVGDWRLSVTSDRPIQAVNVAETPSTGSWSNLSTTAVAGWAPESEAAFEARFLDLTVVFRDGQERTEWRVLAGNRLNSAEMEDGVESVVEAAYRYERIGRDAGRLSFQPDGGARCEMRVYFESPTSGWHAFGCVDNVDRVEYWTGGTWVALNAGVTPLDLGAGPDDRVYTMGTAIEPLTLPAASGGEGALTYSLSPQVPGLNFNPPTRRLLGTPTEAGVHLMTYRVRDASGDTDWRYFNISVEAATGGDQEITFAVGDTLTDLPTGSWTPDVTSDGSFSLSGGDATVRLDEGGYIEEGGFRYTCRSSGGCAIENRRVTSGSVVQTAKGTAPGAGSGVSDDHGADRATATDVEAGSDIPGVLTAGDVDYFSIEVSNSGALEVYSSGNTDTYGYLEDADGETLRSNDDGGAGTNFRISEDITAGTYYVRVRGYSNRVVGDYTLHVRFTESGDTGGGAAVPIFGAGDTLTDLPTGFWTPDVTSGGSFGATGGNVTIELDHDGYIEEGDYRYTCQSTGGCRIENRNIVSGAIAQTSKGTAPDGGDTDLSPSFASGSGPGDQRYTVGTAIDALTLPTGSGGDGALTYSLSPEVPGLSFNATTRRLTGTPTTAGSYNMTYRIRDVDGDTDSLTFTIVVSSQMEMQQFDLDSENRYPEGIVFANGKFYVADWLDGKVYSYLATGERHSASDFDLVSDNGFANGIAFANDRFYVVDRSDDKVYAYETSGERDSASDFDLVSDHRIGGRITFAYDRFYVIDEVNDKVFAYQTTGEPDSDFDFDLDPGNRDAVGIAFANDRIYVVDDSDYKVYAYRTTGLRASESDLYLNPDNGTPAGIAFANGRVYLVDASDDRVYVPTSTDPPPNLAVSASVSNDTPGGDESFVLTATVRNRGPGVSPATTLRYYRSDSRGRISTSDMEVGTDAVSSLATDNASTHSISFPAPAEAGTYYYGACVDEVAEEYSTWDNCSSAVPVFGGGPFPAYDLSIWNAILHNPSSGFLGQGFDMSVTVTNHGPNRSQPAKLRFGSRSYQVIPALDSDETTTIRSIIGSISIGTTRYEACIVEAPGEENTSNNCVSRTVTYF